MWGWLLDVNKLITGPAKCSHKRHESRLRGITASVKHRFCGEIPANTDTQDAADKLVVLPHFETDRLPHRLQFEVPLLQFRREPSLFPAIFVPSSTSGNALLKLLIHRILKFVSTQSALESLGYLQ
jgi:hypothetical protein